MVRRPSCEKEGLNRGPWTPMEDKILSDYIQAHGEGKWRDLPQRAGLKRCGKSCRNRWLNYLRPDIKRGNISTEEDDLIVRLHNLLGNRWSLIAGRLPGRTDNEIKNYWNNNLRKRVPELGDINIKHSTNVGEGNKVMRDRLSRSTSPSNNSNQVIRTKAFRFTKVENITRLPDDHEDQMALNDESQTSSSLVELHEHDKHSFDFLKDFDVNEVLISDMFFNSDINNVDRANYKFEDAELVDPSLEHASFEALDIDEDRIAFISENQWDIGDFFSTKS